MKADERTAISTAQHPPKVWENLLMKFILFLNVSTFSFFFQHINNIHQNIKFTMEEERSRHFFLDTLLKRNNGEISVLVYRKPTHTDQHLHYSSQHQTNYNEGAV